MVCSSWYYCQGLVVECLHRQNVEQCHCTPHTFPQLCILSQLHSEVLQHSGSTDSNWQRSLRREGYWLLHHVQIKFQAFRVLCICQVHWNTDTSSCNLRVTLAACTWLFCAAHGLSSSPEMDGTAALGTHLPFSQSGFSVGGRLVCVRSIMKVLEAWEKSVWIHSIQTTWPGLHCQYIPWEQVYLWGSPWQHGLALQALLTLF